MIARKVIATCVAVAAVALVAACGDKPVVYKQGQYQGKPDSKPWDSAQFSGKQVEWEKAIKARNQGQDEYSRTAAGVR